MKPTVKFNSIETEVIYLKAIIELIDSMVNHSVLCVNESKPYSHICFQTSTDQKYYYIILLDFLSTSSKKITGENKTYLNALRDICKSPNFNKSNSINNLTSSSDNFYNWLEENIEYKKLWLPSIELECSLTVKRADFIYICGNISKHNFTRLDAVANRIITVFQANKRNIDFEDALLILGDFYGQFHDNILNYHGGTISEFLNNIRWGIHEYLSPEFLRSIVYENDSHPRMYHFTYPRQVKKKFARNCYWDLMNDIRHRPIIKKFCIEPILKQRY